MKLTAKETALPLICALVVLACETPRAQTFAGHTYAELQEVLTAELRTGLPRERAEAILTDLGFRNIRYESSPRRLASALEQDNVLSLAYVVSDVWIEVTLDENAEVTGFRAELRHTGT